MLKYLDINYKVIIFIQPKNEYMTKVEMIHAIHQGHKVRHKYFSSDEWLKLTPNGDYEFEDGVVCHRTMFWMDRYQEFWNDGWEIIKK